MVLEGSICSLLLDTRQQTHPCLCTESLLLVAPTTQLHSWKTEIKEKERKLELDLLITYRYIYHTNVKCNVYVGNFPHNNTQQIFF
jgi:hypothetical protein